MTSHKAIRDFVYLDADRLNSLYSQVFEGVAEEIIKSRLYGELEKNSQKGEITKGQIAEAQFSEVKQTTENKVLYDYMYSQLEAKIAGGVLEPSGITAENYRALLSNAFMIKVKGKTEIEDYNRVKVFAKKFNELVGKLAFAEKITQLGISLYQLEAIAKATTGNEKGNLRKLLQTFKDPTQLAQEKGYYQDEELMQLVDMVTEMFYPDGFEITIKPMKGVEGVVFRGVIDRKCLRLQPNFLKALYGGYTDFEWTMLGQITYMPGGQPLETLQLLTPTPSVTEGTAEGGSQLEQEAEGSANRESQGEPPLTPQQKPAELPSMRDPFRTVFGGLSTLERMFLESKQRVEIIMYPLAIYRETLLPIND
jgi:hypothetical protein